MTIEPPPVRIINGRVLDPANGSGARELLLARGQVVEALSADERAAARLIDAAGACVMPGAIDMHSHIASRGVSLAASLEEDSDETRLIGSPRDRAFGYLRQGYTTVIDAAVPPAESDDAHAQLDAMPHIDAGFLVEIGSDATLLHTLAEQGEAGAIEYVGELLEQSSALGVKAVNAGLVDDLDTAVQGTCITPRDLLLLAARAVERYDLAHPLHVHAPCLGEPGNVDETLAVLAALGEHRVHVAHGQFSAYGEDASGGYASGVARLIDYLHAHGRVTMDAGCIDFGPAWMVTRDQLLAQRLAETMRRSLTQRGGWSVMAMHYHRTQPVNALQWAMGLELMLRCDDLTRLALSVDFPNGGSYQAMPRLLRLLASRAERERVLDHVHPWARQRTGLAELSHELSDDDLVTVTRRAPALALGLACKGHLDTGADGDVVIAPRPDAAPATIIKAGRVIFEGDQWQADTPGQRLTWHST